MVEEYVPNEVIKAFGNQPEFFRYPAPGSRPEADYFLFEYPIVNSRNREVVIKSIEYQIVSPLVARRLRQFSTRPPHHLLFTDLTLAYPQHHTRYYLDHGKESKHPHLAVDIVPRVKGFKPMVFFYEQNRLHSACLESNDRKSKEAGLLFKSGFSEAEVFEGDRMAGNRIGRLLIVKHGEEGFWQQRESLKGFLAGCSDGTILRLYAHGSLSLGSLDLYCEYSLPREIPLAQLQILLKEEYDKIFAIARSYPASFEVEMQDK